MPVVPGTGSLLRSNLYIQKLQFPGVLGMIGWRDLDVKKIRGIRRGDKLLKA